MSDSRLRAHTAPPPYHRYVEAPLALGPMFGAEESFKGLGIIFDSWDDDRVRASLYCAYIFLGPSR